MVTQVSERTYTLDEYLALPDDGKKYELVDGRLVEMSGTSYDHGEIVENLRRPLANFVWERQLGGIVTDVAFAYISGKPNNARRPDLAFVELIRLTGFDRSKAAPFAPDLAVEIVSPTDTALEVNEKALEYIQYGTRLVWVVYFVARFVLIYQPSNDPTDPLVSLATYGGELSGEGVIPGFTIKVRNLFHKLTSAQPATQPHV